MKERPRRDAAPCARTAIKLHALAALTLAISATLAAEETLPWGLIHTATSWEGESFFSPFDEDVAYLPGFGAGGAFELRGLLADPFALSLRAGYRWREADGFVSSYPGLALDAGWRFFLSGPAALTPFAGLGFEAAIEGDGARPRGLGRLGTALSLRFAGENYLSLTPALTLPFSEPASARLSLSLGLKRETSWLIPVRPVSARLTASPALFSPDGDGQDDEVAIAIKARSPRSAQRWKLSVFSGDVNGDGEESEFYVVSGLGRVPSRIDWNGLTSDGRLPDPGVDYRLDLETVDRAGRIETASATITCDILIINEGDRYKIRVPAIRFPSNSFNLSARESKELYEANRAVLERIATLFLRFPDYSLIVEGHANPVYANDPARFEREQREELLPLSEKRAETVRQALILAGIEGERMLTTGKGGLEPLTNEQDPESVSKNRRVEFILLRNRSDGNSSGR